MIRDNRTGRLPVHKTEANYASRSLPVCSRDPDGRRGPRSEQVDQGRCLVACVRHGRPRQRQQVRTVGADPKGIIIFTPDGHFALFQSRAKLPKIAPTIAPRRPPRRQQRSLPDRLLISGRIRSMKARGPYRSLSTDQHFPISLRGLFRSDSSRRSIPTN